jgi:hypothetical protein
MSKTISMRLYVIGEKKMTFAEVIATSKYNEQIHFKREKLTISSELFMDMFKEPIQNIIHEIKNDIST